MLVIWGLVGRKLFLKPTKVEAQNTGTYVAKHDLINDIKKDTFTLTALARDPFLKTRTPALRPNTGKNSRKSSKSAIKKSPKKIQWPSISFHGLVKSARSKDELVLLKVSGKSHFISVGDTIGALTLKHVMRDAVTLEFQGEQKVFKKR